MRIAVTGSTGLIGSALVPALQSTGHHITRLVRGQPAATDEGRWDPATGPADAIALEGHDAVVHLAGEPIGQRWTAARKRRIHDSRALGTRALAECIAGLTRKPQVLICSSAVGYYGDRGDAWLREDSAPGDDFLAGVCQEWEAACAPAADAGIRVVNLRTGVVLSTRGGALAKMLTPFRLGLGGVLGSGRQYLSWVSLDDLVRVFQHALATDALRGPVNATAPNPVTNREFTKTLGRVLRRPTIFPMPAFAVSLLFGEMGRSTLLASQRVESARLAATGFRFHHPELEGALRAALEV